MTETIHIGNQALQELPALLQNRAFSKVAVLVDENTLAHCYPLLKPHLPAPGRAGPGRPGFSRSAS